MKVNFKTRRNMVLKMVQSNLAKGRNEASQTPIEKMDERPESHYSRFREDISPKKTFELPHLESQQLLSLLNMTDFLEPRDRKVIFPFQHKHEFDLKRDELKLDQWLGQMYSAVVSASFQCLTNGELSYEEVKVYCSENLLLNVLLFLEKVNENDIIQTMKHINFKLKDNLSYLLSKYPQTKEVQPNKKLRQAISSINNMENDENDMVLLSKINFIFNDSADYTSEIMTFINFLIQLPTTQCTFKGKKKTYFQAFSQMMEKIFQWVQYPEEIFSEQYMFTNITSFEHQVDEYENIQEEAYFQGEAEEEEQPIQYRSKKGVLKQKQSLFDDSHKNITQKQLKEYKQKIKRYTNYKIGSKINPNTQLYREHEISQGSFIVKSTAILRILTKWTEELQKKLFDSKDQILKRSFRFKGKDRNFIKLNASQKNNLYQGIIKEVPEIKRFIKGILDDCIEIEAFLGKKVEKTKQMYHIPKNEYIVGEFCSKLQSAASTYLVNYLNKIMHVLLMIPENSFQQGSNQTTVKSKDVNLITFKVSDLMRCKCSSHETEILRIFNLLKRISDDESEIFKIIRIKDRLSLGTRDILININFMNKILCEIQLAVTDEIDKKQKMYDSFNHYLYELKRSNLGPIMQSACIWTHLDQRSKQFRYTFKSMLTMCNVNLNYRKHLCSSEFMVNHKYSFICSLCGIFYPAPKGLISSKKCKYCSKYFECRNCIENRMTPGELKSLLRLNQGSLKFFQKDFELWIPTQTSTFPDFCLMIPKNHKKIKYYFVQKINLKGESYLLHIQEDDKNKLVFNTITSFKEDIYEDFLRIVQEFFIYQWKEKRLVNRTLTAHNHLQILRREEEREKEELQKRKSERDEKKSLVKEQRKRMWRMEAIQESSEENEHEIQRAMQENEANKAKKQRRRKRIQKDNEETAEEKKVKSKFGNAILMFQSKNFHRPPSEKSKRSGYSSSSQESLRKHRKRKRVKEVQKEQFIEVFSKRSQFNDVRISEKQHNGVLYYLILGFYVKESSLKVHIKNKLNIQMVEDLYENKTEVIFLEEEKIKQELSIGMYNLRKFSASLRNIVELYIDENKIKNIEFVKELRKLQIFHANHNFIQNISFLENLHHLTEVMIENNSITKIQGLKNKMKLTLLDLSKNHIQFIENLEDCQSLTTLSLCSNNIVTIQNLDSLKELKELDLSLNGIETIENLEQLDALVSLNLMGNNIIKIQSLGTLKQLNNLCLNYNFIEKIEGLDFLEKLQKLQLFCNCIKKIENLNSLTKLKILQLGHNFISKIENLEQVRLLTHLHLERNNISDFYDYEKIQNLFDLQVFDLSYNSLRFISHDLLEFLPKLKNLSIINNPIRRTDMKNVKSIEIIRKQLPNFTYKVG